MATKAYNALLKYGDALGSESIAIARVKSIKPPKIKAKDIDITVLDSPDEFDEMIAGLANGGDVEMVVEYDKTKTTTVYGLFRTTKFWKIQYADSSGWQFQGYINEYGDDEVVNGDIVRNTFKVKVTGKPTANAALS